MVSIIMPAYNAERFIAEAVRSVIGQSYQEWELIVVNDGSTDGTQTYLDSLSDPRIQVIHQQNRGVSAARNTALELAKGEYITFLDADDVLPPKSLEVRAAFLQAHPEVDVVDGIISVRDEALQDEQRCYRPYYNGKLLPRLLRLDDRVFFGVVYMVRRSSMGNTRFAEGITHAEDLRFYIEMASRQALEYGHVDELVYLYRKSDSSAMANMEGLERGYLQLLGAVRRVAGINMLDRIIMRFKIAKILFLSWGKNGSWKRGYKASIHCCVVK